MNEHQMASNIITKIHGAGGEEALIRFFDSKGEDFPPIKLTSQEMSFIKGGGFLSWLKRNADDIIDILGVVTGAARIVGGIATGNPMLVASGGAGLYKSVNGLLKG